MVVKLSDEQREALARASGPIYVSDDVGNERYVLLPTDTYERIRSLIDDAGAGDVTDAYAAQDAVARTQGWDDPVMDEYNDYDAHHKPTREGV